jgi:hypothetical protein
MQNRAEKRSNFARVRLGINWASIQRRRLAQVDLGWEMALARSISTFSTNQDLRGAEVPTLDMVLARSSPSNRRDQEDAVAFL